jgi:prophage regulatory protein
METKAEKATIIFIRIKQVMAMCGMSRSAIYGAMRKGEFPAQVKISERSCAWLHSEVAAWGDARVKAARADQAKKARAA